MLAGSCSRATLGQLSFAREQVPVLQLDPLGMPDAAGMTTAARADRIMSATQLDQLLPAVFEARASCADAAVNLAWNEIRHRAQLVKSYEPVPPVLASEARLGQVLRRVQRRQ